MYVNYLISKLLKYQDHLVGLLLWKGRSEKTLQLEMAELGIKEQKELLHNLSIHECMCLNSGSALNCAILGKLLKHSETSTL